MFVGDTKVDGSFEMTEDDDYEVSCVATSKPEVKDSSVICNISTDGVSECTSQYMINKEDDEIRCSFTYECPSFNEVTVEETRPVITNFRNYGFCSIHNVYRLIVRKYR